MNETAKKAASGLGWLAIIRYSNRLAGFVTTLILAKFVAPEDFGLIVIATMVLEFINIMKDMGISQALIFHRSDLTRSTGTAFIIVMTVNLTLFALVVAFAPLMASFFNADGVLPILVVMSSNLVWFGLRAVPAALINKALEFRKLVIPSVVPIVIASIVSIWMAVVGFGVWSLVARSLIVEILSTALIWKYTNFRPSLIFDRAVALELLGYGKYIIGASIVGVLLYNVDKIYITKFASTSMLGLYTLAYTIANVPVAELGHLVCRVMFPALSKLNDDQTVFRDGVLRALELTAILSIPLGIGIAVYSAEMVKLFFDVEWWRMILPLQLLAVAATFRATSVLIHESCKAIGRPNIVQWMLAFRLLLVGVLGLPAIIYGGIDALAGAIALVYCLAFVLESTLISKWVGLPSGELYRALAFPLIVGAILIFGIYWLTSLVITPQSLGHLLVGVSLTIISYLLVTLQFRKPLISSVRNALEA